MDEPGDPEYSFHQENISYFMSFNREQNISLGQGCPFLAGAPLGTTPEGVQTAQRRKDQS